MSQENKERYTPGPWNVQENYIVDSRLDLTIAEVYPSAQIEANIRLIAEAPNMFALIKQCLDIDKNEERQCSCSLCEAGRRIVARVLGEE